MSCLAYASGVGLGKQGIATVLESAATEGGFVAEKIGTRDNATGGSIAQIFAECATDEFVSVGGARPTSCPSLQGAANRSPAIR